MRKIEMFECEDGKLFHKESEAVAHEGLLVKVAAIVSLFGKKPKNEDWVTVPEANIIKADALIKELINELGLECDVTSRKASENEYMYSIWYIKSSMAGNVLYSQPYFVHHPKDATGKEIPFEA